MDTMIVYCVRLIVACLCGFLIGMERSARMKSAGVRTHVVLIAACTLFTIISKDAFPGADPSRIAAQIVTGVGFIGAGVIFKDGSTLKGLSTASGILATAAVGMAIGSGFIAIGLVVTAIVLAIQVAFHRFSVGFDAYSQNEAMLIFVENEETEKKINALESRKSIKIKKTLIQKHNDGTIEKQYRFVYKNTPEVFKEIQNFVNDEKVMTVTIG